MIFDASSVAAGFLAAFRVGLAVAVVVTSVKALQAASRARTAGERDAAEVVALRPALPAMALYALCVASWPLLVEVLAGYVPLWGSVMCIDGVTRIGEGNVGPARHLPWLLDLLFALKPLLLLAGGAWLVTHLVRRRAHGRPGVLAPALLLVLGVLALLDGAAEVAYLVIPKREETLSAGCCVVTSFVTADPQRSWLEWLTRAVVTGVSDQAAYALLGAGTLVLVGALVPSARHRVEGAHAGRPALVAALAAAATVLVAAQHVFVAVASPRFTGISTHRCGWCVVEGSPLGGASMGLLLLAVGVVPLVVLASGLERRSGGPAAVSRTTARLVLLALAVSGVLLALATA